MNHIPSGKYIYPNLLNYMQNNEEFILATVVNTHGSVPQIPGSSAVIGKKNVMEGTIGGGVVEHTIKKVAADAIKSKKSGYYRFDLDDEITKDNAAICGGGMNVLLDANPKEHLSVFKALATSYQNRIPGVLLTLANTVVKDNLVIERIWINAGNFKKISNRFDAELNQKIKNMLEESAPGKFCEIVRHTSPEYEDKYVFLECIAPRPRLIIAGAGHVGKALANIGKWLDFEVTVWDDREEYANKKNIPDADIVMKGELNQTLGALHPQPDTFIVIVTRGHKKDAEVLKKFIRSKAGYIGMIGSRNKIAKLKDQFIKNDWASPEQWEKIHAPIGIYINSKTVQEIAVSIAAQLIQVRHNLNKTNE